MYLHIHTHQRTYMIRAFSGIENSIIDFKNRWPRLVCEPGHMCTMGIVGCIVAEHLLLLDLLDAHLLLIICCRSTLLAEHVAQQWPKPQYGHTGIHRHRYKHIPRPRHHRHRHRGRQTQAQTQTQTHTQTQTQALAQAHTMIGPHADTDTGTGRHTTDTDTQQNREKPWWITAFCRTCPAPVPSCF